MKTSYIAEAIDKEYRRRKYIEEKRKRAEKRKKTKENEYVVNKVIE